MSETELFLAFAVGFLSWPVLERVILPYVKRSKVLSKKAGGKQ